MLSWVSRLKAVYTDALRIAVRMPPAPMTSVFVLNDIIDNNLHEAYPESVAELIDYLSHCELSDSVWCEATGLIKQLCQSDIPEILKTRLHEIVAELALG